MRCKACDCVMGENEIYLNEETGKMEELCSSCLTMVYDVLKETEESEETSLDEYLSHSEEE